MKIIKEKYVGRVTCYLVWKDTHLFSTYIPINLLKCASMIEGQFQIIPFQKSFNRLETHAGRSTERLDERDNNIL